jgi:hypothetical protein
LRSAAVFDAQDEAGRWCFSADRRRVVGSGERAALARYLESAPLVLRASGLEVDPRDPQAGPVLPLSYRTDGVWVWQEASAYYLRSRGAAPDEELVRHAASVGFVVPQSVPDDVLAHAEELVMSADPPQPVWGRRHATYFASVSPGYPPHAPGGLLRQWFDHRGHRIDESLRRDMRWKHTPAFLVNARNGEHDYEEIPAMLAAQIADRWWADWREASS